MGFKEVLSTKFNEEQTILLSRYHSAKFFFMLLTFIFSLNFFFVGASFYSSIFEKTLYLSYILLLISFFSYLYYLSKMKLFGKVKNNVFYIVLAIFFIIFLFLLFPMVVKV